MKKVLSLVLVLTMVLGSFSFAFAEVPSDVVGTEYEGAVTRLASLEILEGYTDGTFKPENTITRAEFAAALVRALGLEDAAKASGGATGFNDVQSGHWATGYINIATKMGYVKGMGDGTFAPSAPITYEQAVTLVVRALGYEPAATARGGYPYGHLVVASEEGVTDDVNGVQGAPAPRGLVAQLLDNSLTIPMMVQVGYGDETKWVKSGTKEHENEIKILTDKLGIDEIKGRVVADSMTDGKLDDNEITIDVKDDKEKDFEVAESLSAEGFLGLEVVAWEGKDGKIFKIENDTDEKDVMYDAVKTTDKDDVYLIVEDDEFEWSKDAIAYVNNDETKVEDVEANAYGRFVLNDDKEVIFAYLFDIDTDDTGVVTKVSSDEIEFASVGSAGIDMIEFDDDGEVYVFNTDLSKASVDDIDEDMGIFYWEDGDDYYIIISDDVVEGTLESVRVRDGRLTVEGTNVTWDAEAIYSDDEGKNYNDYDKSVDEDVEAIESLIKEEVTVYKNLVGKAMVLTTGAKVSSDTIYGLVTWITDGRYPEMSVFTSEGKEVEYKFANSDLVDEVRDVLDEEWNKGYYGAIGFEVNKDGEISKIVEDGKDNLQIAEKYDAELVKKDSGDKYIEYKVGTDKDGKDIYERYYLNSRSVIIKAVDKDNTKVRPSLIKQEELVDKNIAFDSADPTANEAILLKSGREVGLLVFVDKGFKAVDTTKYGIVVSDITANSDDDYVADIDVAGEGKEEYVMANKDAKKGDLVEFQTNSDGEVVVDRSSIIKADDESKVQDVIDKSYNTLNIGGHKYVATDDTVYYEVDEDGDLKDKTRKLANIVEGKDTVIILTDGDELKVVVITTEMKEHSGKETGNGDFEINKDNATMTLATAGEDRDVQVAATVYAGDDWAGKVDFEVEVDKTLIGVKDGDKARGAYDAHYDVTADGEITFIISFEDAVFAGETIELKAGAIKVTAKDKSGDDGKEVTLESKAGEVKVEMKKSSEGK